jgi:hypothetical protein
MALVESILLGLVMIVPLVWGLVMLDHVHRAALGATTAAREAGLAAGRLADSTIDRSSVDRAVALALRSQQLDTDRARVELSFPEGMVRGGLVRVGIRYPVPMLDLPVLGELPSVWVTAHHDAVIDRYRSR